MMGQNAAAQFAVVHVADSSIDVVHVADSSIDYEGMVSLLRCWVLVTGLIKPGRRALRAATRVSYDSQPLHRRPD